MKVSVVTIFLNDGKTGIAVFSTLKKAEMFSEKIENQDHPPKREILEMEIDGCEKS